VASRLVLALSSRWLSSEFSRAGSDVLTQRHDFRCAVMTHIAIRGLDLTR
jgi:hypothetical protein